MPGEHDGEVRLAGRRDMGGWTPAVGVSGWLLSLAAVVIVVPLLGGVLVAAGLELDTVSVALIPVTPVVTGLVALAVATTIVGGSARRLFGGGRAGPGALLLGAVLGVVAFVVFNLLLGALLVHLLQLLGVGTPEVQPTLRDAATRPEALPILVLSTTIAAPLGEELLYRGLLFQSLLTRLRPAAAMWLSALAFGVGHVALGAAWLSNVILAALIVPLGVLLAWSFHRWQTLWVPIVMHSVFNAITVALMGLGVV